ncbi:S-layer homology domain-containing protein [Paenibacillus eucommiae]|nr:S-layer homology domain-containing protein [Paenibacillus eucommiae]
MIRKIAGFTALCLFIFALLPISHAHAAVKLGNISLDFGPQAYNVAGEKIKIRIMDDRAIGTSLEYLRILFSSDNGKNWSNVLDFHQEGYDGEYETATFRLPIDPAVTRIRLRVSAKYSPLLGSDSFPTTDIYTYEMMQPGSASNFVAKANQDGSVALSWNDNSNMESYYQINRGGGKDGEKTFIVKDTMNHIGPLSFVDKETSTDEDTFYLYTIIPVIDQFVMDNEVKPSVQFASVISKPQNGILKFKEKFGKLEMSAIISKVITMLPKDYAKVDEDAIVQKLPDFLDPEEIKWPDLPTPGGGGSGSSTGGGASTGGSPVDDAVLEELVKGSSDWAKGELKQAIQLLLTTAAVIGNYQQPITREHFAGIAVKLYETLSGKKAEAVSTNPFTDTTSEDVLKANNAGIVFGVAADKFAPDATISRQEICVMLQRAVQAAKPALAMDTSHKSTFADENSIAPWAIDAVRFASNLSIMSGIGDNRMDPLGKTTREQAIVLVKRAFEALK